jgi:hypothetical protein
VRQQVVRAQGDYSYLVRRVSEETSANHRSPSSTNGGPEKSAVMLALERQVLRAASLSIRAGTFSLLAQPVNGENISSADNRDFNIGTSRNQGSSITEIRKAHASVRLT